VRVTICYLCGASGSAARTETAPPPPARAQDAPAGVPMSTTRRLRAVSSAVCGSCYVAASTQTTKKGPPQPAYVRSPRFSLSDSAGAWKYLDEHGYTIIKAVLSDKEVAEALDLFWGTLECLGAGIDRNEPASWGTDAASLVFTDAGVIHPHGVIQSKATWYVRGVPAIKEAFARLWGTDDLITSFDGICAFRPWHIDRSWRTRGPWFHTDQPPFAPSPDYTGPYGFQREYVQGFVNLVETTPASGGNVVVPVCNSMSS
jgi:hypothetical protein